METSVGAKTWMLVYAETDARAALATRAGLDHDATLRLAEALFPGERLTPVGQGDLSDTHPPDDELYIGSFPRVSIVAAKEFAIDRPSRLAPRFLAPAAEGSVTLHAMHSVVDWFAYARWDHGKLLRSLSVSPDTGVMEDLGVRMGFEEPYWSGEHPVETGEERDAYPLPFHPLELGDAALAALFGYQLEGPIDAALLDPESIPLLRFKRSRPSWWQFWRGKT
jgi:hypothetical protein